MEALRVTKASVDVRERSKRLIMDIITEMLLRSSTGTLVREHGDDLNAFSYACEYSQNVKIAIAPKAKPWSGSKARQPRQLLHSTIGMSTAIPTERVTAKRAEKEGRK